MCAAGAFRGSPAFDLASLAPLAARIAPRGWHLQLHLPAQLLAEQANVLQRLPAPIVIDHLGRLPQPPGVAHPAFAALRALLDAGNTWVKLSGAYHDSATGAPAYADTSAVARALVAAAPQRLLWGSDWPHPSASASGRPFPDTAQLFDLLCDWAPDAAQREQILVSNPEALYGFEFNQGTR